MGSARSGCGISRAQTARSVAIVVARVEHDEIGVRGEDRLDVRAKPRTEIRDRARRDRPHVVRRATDQAIPSADREEHFGGGRTERDDAARR
jgi:hypothetical protein